MAKDTDREFLVGATIKLTVDTYDPDTRTPYDPGDGVVLEVVRRQAKPAVPAQTLPGSTAFTRKSTGVFFFRLDTTGYTPGTYVWRARAHDDVLGTALRQDTFVLVAPA